MMGGETPLILFSRRLALRLLVKNPGATALAVLGIGLTTGLFAVERPRDLWRVSSRGDDGNYMMYGWLDYLDMAKALEGRGQVVATQRRGIMVGQDEDSEMAMIQPASSNFFRVAGVMPEVFTGFERGVAVGVWVSADAWFHALGARDEEQSRSGQFEVVARFHAPLTAARATAEFDAAIRGPEKHKPAPASVSATWLQGFVHPWEEDIILGGGLAFVLGLVLFVACANVAQLRLAQAEARRKELAVRLALGGGRWRVARQLLVEASLLAAAGAGLGLLLAQFLIDKITQFGRAVGPFIDMGIRPDYRVLAFSAGALLLAVLVTGLGPALHVARLNVADWR